MLSPSFTPSSIPQWSSPTYISRPSYNLNVKPYLPGYIGLNNIKRHDHMNVVIHALLHVQPLRDYLLLSSSRSKSSELVRRFAALAKKLWNPRLFKSQVSPHEFLQEIARASGGKFRLEKQGDPVEFLGWLLNQLHKDMGGTKRRNSSAFCKPRRGPQYLRRSFAGIIFSTFQGELRVETQQILVRPDTGTNHKPVFDIDRGTVGPLLVMS